MGSVVRSGGDGADSALLLDPFGGDGPGLALSSDLGCGACGVWAGTVPGADLCRISDDLGGLLAEKQRTLTTRA